MRAASVLLLITALSFALPSGATPADATAPERAPAASYNFSAVGDAIENAVQTMPLPGASMMIVKDGELVYERYFGSYNAGTLVFIASATKWQSAATFMTLVDDGLIDLDDTVSEYLPEWTGEMGTITMRQLWSHTSGLPGLNAEPPCLSSYTLTLAQCVEEIRVTGLAASPGSRFDYGGASMQVAGRIAEVAAGQSWVTLFNERIAAPLGMTATTWWPTAANPRIGGGLRSTLGDYGRFMTMLLAGGAYGSEQILLPATVAEMQVDQTGGAPIFYTPHPDSRRYGVGEWRDTVADNGDAIQLSSQGAFGFSPWLDVERGYHAVFLVQDQLADVYVLVNELQQLVRDALDAGPASVGGNVDEPSVEAPAVANSPDGERAPSYWFALVVVAPAAGIAAFAVMKGRRTAKKGD
jgi:CubicO group peptidase (beta-lactamase class C family)